ncbi:uncharacterized protein [Gossypium hirsutum]|uniref:Uncharacterized protein n=1 Tax=Gossypium hirsutum TaxID=3635 RepID=A0ABM3BX42_GOSHI|nr:uncharacterized protein LOC121230636 [Gossypium hirsutum]
MHKLPIRAKHAQISPIKQASFHLMHLSKLFLLASVPFLASKTFSPFLSSTQPLGFLALGAPPPQPQRLVVDDEGETPPAAWSRPTPVAVADSGLEAWPCVGGVADEETTRGMRR